MAYEIVPLDAERQRADLIRLIGANLSRASEERFDWFYRSANEAPRTLVAETESGGIAVGSASLLPLSMEGEDGACRGAVAVDFNVEPEHRAYGPALKLQRALLGSLAEMGIDVVWAYPNQQSAPVFRRIGYRELGASRRWVKVLRSEYIVARHLRSRVTRMMAAAVLNLALRTRDLVAVAASGRHRMRCEMLDGFDERFDALWERRSRDRRFLVQRSARHLSWRYGRCPLVKYGVFAAVGRAGSEVHGYVVFHREEDSLVVADYFWDGREGGGPALFQGFFSYARSTRARSVFLTALENRHTSDVLRRLGFQARESNRPVLVYAGAGNAGFPAWADVERWHLTDGDLDL